MVVNGFLMKNKIFFICYAYISLNGFIDALSFAGLYLMLNKPHSLSADGAFFIKIHRIVTD